VAVRYRALMIDMALASVGGLVFALFFKNPFQAFFEKRLLGSGDAEAIRIAGGLTEFYGVLLGLTVGIFFFLVIIACVEGVWGTSPGKRFQKIEIRHESGRSADRTSLILRAVVKNLGILLSFLAIPMRSTLFAVLSTLTALVVGLGYCMAFDKRRQTLHDRIAETAVFSTGSLLGASEILLIDKKIHDLIEKKEKPTSGSGDGATEKS
jgi:uncharacterized RDD family membrane protein YckC